MQYQLFLRPDGYGEPDAADGAGSPAFLDLHGGRLQVVAFPDLNAADPVLVPLDGAREGLRRTAAEPLSPETKPFQGASAMQDVEPAPAAAAETFAETLARWARRDEGDRTEAAAELAETLARVRDAFPDGTDAGRVEDLLGRFLPGGYENNDGGQGVVTIDLASGAVEIGHQWNVSEVEEDPRSFVLAPPAAGPAEADDAAEEEPVPD